MLPRFAQLNEQIYFSRIALKRKSLEKQGGYFRWLENNDRKKFWATNSRTKYFQLINTKDEFFEPNPMQLQIVFLTVPITL